MLSVSGLKDDGTIVGLSLLPDQLKCLRTARIVGCYTASTGDYLLTFRDYLAVPYSGVNNPRTNYAAEVLVQPHLLGPQPHVLQYIVVFYHSHLENEKGRRPL